MILVTGGTGFVGSHLLYKLVTMGVPVKAMKREKSSLKVTKEIFSYYSKQPKTLLSRVQWVIADFKDQDSLEEMLAGVKKVYHCAGFISSLNPQDSY